jgi:hypothetical protein
MIRKQESGPGLSVILTARSTFWRKWRNTLSCGLAGKSRYDRTLVGVNPPSSKDPADPPSAEELAAAKKVGPAGPAHGVALTGPGGLLKALTKTVLETALEGVAEHLGYDMHDPLGRNRTTPVTGNAPNGVLNSPRCRSDPLCGS